MTYIMLVIIAAIMAGLFMPTPCRVKRLTAAGERLTAQVTMMGEIMHRSSISVADIGKSMAMAKKNIRKRGLGPKEKG